MLQTEVAMALSLPDYQRILARTKNAADPVILAFAGVIWLALQAGKSPLIRGLAEDRFQRMLAAYFPGLILANGETSSDDARYDEFSDVLQLLLEYRVEASEERAWLCSAIASASMGDNHLWQDMGLPNRNALSELMAQNFPRLKALNAGDMKWKKFFYRQLCERAHIPICKSPSCAICTDYKICFGTEELEGQTKSIPVVLVKSTS